MRKTGGGVGSNQYGKRGSSTRRPTLGLATPAAPLLHQISTRTANESPSVDRLAAAKGVATARSHLTRLAKDKDAAVREAVANNKLTPPDVLIEMATTDESIAVRAAAFKHCPDTAYITLCSSSADLAKRADPNRLASIYGKRRLALIHYPDSVKALADMRLIAEHTACPERIKQDWKSKSGISPS